MQKETQCGPVSVVSLEMRKVHLVVVGFDQSQPRSKKVHDKKYCLCPKDTASLLGTTRQKKNSLAVPFQKRVAACP